MQIITIGVLLLLSSMCLALELHGCPNRYESYYPKCDSIDENIGYDAYQKKYIPICPSTSTGQYPPNCRCRYGGAYNETSNLCPHPQCPTNSVTHQSHPNCMCIEHNKEYNAYLNECVAKCPANSSGRFPACKCNDEMENFNKDWFVCDRCPSNSRPDSVFPDCVCESGNYLTSLWGEYLNECINCREGTTGSFPDCFCENGNTGWHYPEKHDCESCPWDSKGKFPNCICEKSKKLITKHPTHGYMCYDCPVDSDGVYPDCLCTEFAYYDNIMNVCRNCPAITTPIKGFPHCKCLNEKSSYVPEFDECRECPFNSIGKYPNCTCDEENHLFSSYMNLCYPECFEPSSTALEFNMTACVERYAFAGRDCPPDSIGSSPNCKCFDGKTFIPYGWGCYETNVFAFGAQNCPNKEHKFPQCEVSIDMKVLITLIG